MRTLPALVLLCAAAAAPAAPHPVETAPELLRRVLPGVEKACGARFKTAPAVRELSADEAGRLFAEDVRPELERKYPGATEGQMRFLMRGAASASVRSCVARYSVSAKAIVLVRSGFDEQRRAIRLAPEDAGRLHVAALAHEAVHALDDARFDLGKLYRGAADQEALRAVAMVVEGRAVHFGRQATAGLDVPAAIRDRLPGGDAPEGSAEISLHLTYRLGERFVARLVERGGPALADRALREPPRLTHLVCQPDRWPDSGDGAETASMASALSKAFEAEAQPLSELLLRARYAALDGMEAAERLFAGYRDGAQVAAGDANLSVLRFETEEDARRYAERSRAEAAVRQRGERVVRAAGPSAEEVLERYERASSVAGR